ncbi:topoisomerase DNA-binding C4 zinc finger domain-containing protein [Rectinema subterraneum]|uniref:topoisomerase DNA-binding C4 zinc finger domain-containing protein n=1 Tax=Rectinema subterraneum TaxID=2653714 RepID=UPI00131A619C
MTEHDAMDFAKLFGIKCPNCDAEMKGRKGSNGMFLGCSRYPTCKGTRSLKDLI